MTTGEVLRFLRQQKGATQEEVGEILGVQKSAIQKYENGSVVNLKLDAIRKLCFFFQIPPWILIFPENVSKLKEYGETESGDEFHRYLVDFSRLNIHGRRRLYSYAHDLALIEKYMLPVELQADSVKPANQQETNI